MMRPQGRARQKAKELALLVRRPSPPRGAQLTAVGAAHRSHGRGRDCCCITRRRRDCSYNTRRKSKHIYDHRFRTTMERRNRRTTATASTKIGPAVDRLATLQTMKLRFRFAFGMTKDARTPSWTGSQAGGRFAATSSSQTRRNAREHAELERRLASRPPPARTD
eukprot:9504065-Pyramimonas_sp.AAC.3